MKVSGGLFSLPTLEGQDTSMTLSASGSPIHSMVCGSITFVSVTAGVLSDVYVCKFFSSYKNTGYVGSGPSLMTLYELYYIYQNSIFK